MVLRFLPLIVAFHSERHSLQKALQESQNLVQYRLFFLSQPFRKQTLIRGHQTLELSSQVPYVRFLHKIHLAF